MHRNKTYSKILSEAKRELEEKGISESELRLLICYLENEKGIKCEKGVNKTALTVKEIKTLYYNGILNEQWARKSFSFGILHKMAWIVNMLIFFIALAFVIPYMFLGYDNFMPGVPYFSIVVFSGILIVIFFLEGLEISVTKLISGASRNKTLRLYLRNDRSRERFYGARQVTLLLLVFIAAELTTFPTVSTFPFTNITFTGHYVPTEIVQILDTLFLKWGLAGAFIVATVGQLIPKIKAQRNPDSFLSEKVRYLLVSFDKIGIPAIADLISSRSDTKEVTGNLIDVSNYFINIIKVEKNIAYAMYHITYEINRDYPDISPNIRIEFIPVLPVNSKNREFIEGRICLYENANKEKYQFKGGKQVTYRQGALSTIGFNDKTFSCFAERRNGFIKGSKLIIEMEVKWEFDANIQQININTLEFGSVKMIMVQLNSEYKEAYYSFHSRHEFELLSKQTVSQNHISVKKVPEINKIPFGIFFPDKSAPIFSLYFTLPI